MVAEDEYVRGGAFDFSITLGPTPEDDQQGEDRSNELGGAP